MEKDVELLNILYRALLGLRTEPTKKQRDLLNGLYRINKLQHLKDEASHSLARKIRDRTHNDDIVK